MIETVQVLMIQWAIVIVVLLGVALYKHSGKWLLIAGINAIVWIVVVAIIMVLIFSALA